MPQLQCMSVLSTSFGKSNTFNINQTFDYNPAIFSRLHRLTQAMLSEFCCSKRRLFCQVELRYDVPYKYVLLPICTTNLYLVFALVA